MKILRNGKSVEQVEPPDAADLAIQKAAMSMGSTDEWSDQSTMIADFQQRFESLAAERDRLSKERDEAWEAELSAAIARSDKDCAALHEAREVLAALINELRHIDGFKELHAARAGWWSNSQSDAADWCAAAITNGSKLSEAREALVKLSNEVFASIPMADLALRQAIGNTNYNVLMLRAEEARAVLAKLSANGVEP
jgi:hypothetical protein